MKKYNEKEYEELLKIKTSGRDASKSDTYNYPYEPTDYRVLKLLARSGYINKKNHLIDFGSGKGRVSFYLSYETGCKSTGIEYDERLYSAARENLDSYGKQGKVNFECINAIQYRIPSDADCFYFFNPFSKEILSGVLKNIADSYYENERKMMLFFYYPADEYIEALMQKDELLFEDEIECNDFFDGKSDKNRERILVFSIGI